MELKIKNDENPATRVFSLEHGCGSSLILKCNDKNILFIYEDGDLSPQRDVIGKLGFHILGEKNGK